MRSYKMVQIIDRVRYNTETATEICSDTWWDGHNHERSGTNTFLFRSPKGAYFFQHLTQWQGDSDRLAPCSVDEAYEFYEQCAAHQECNLSLEEAFPSVKVENA